MMKRIALFSLLAITLAPLSAQAEEVEPTWSIDLQLGSYKPRIDSQFTREAGDVTPPYEQAFGDGSSLMISFAAERQLFRGFGSLSLGLGFAYWNVEGNSVRPDNASETDAADTTEMSIYPLNLQATYRFDVLAQYVPLIPVLRGGVDYYMWRIFDGSGDVASFSNGNDAQGGTAGYHYAVGVHLLLDALDDEMATDFQRDAGVYNSYITLEYRYAQVDDFGSSKSFRLGDEAFFVGLALDL